MASNAGTDPPPSGASFRTSAGEVVRLHDCVCWRWLEGRPCLPQHERDLAAATDLVLIPVPPSGYNNSKRARKAASSEPAAAAPQPVAHAHTATARGTDGAAASCERDVLLAACTIARDALQASGLRCVVDDCPRSTPGAKYNRWEGRGVGLRVEVGLREAAARTYCLALHPRLAALLPAASAAAGATTAAAQTRDHPVVATATAGATANAAASSQDAPGVGSDSAAPAPAPAPASHSGQGKAKLGGSATAGRGLRLQGLGLEALLAACHAVHGAQPPPGDPPPGDGSSIRVGSSNGGSSGGSWCGKLHLWPVQAEAWRSTEAAVAALLAALEVEPGGSDRRSGFAAAAAAPAASGGSSAAVTGAGGSSTGAGGSSTGGGQPVPARPCVAHLRHLLQLGRPCYCGQGHYSLSQLQQEVAARWAESRPGADISEWVAAAPPRPQQLPGTGAARTGAQVEAVAVSQPQRNLQQWKQKQQQRQHMRKQQSRGKQEADAEGGNDALTINDLGDDLEDGSDGDDGGSGRVLLLVGNIPPSIKASVVQSELGAAFAPFGCRGVSVSRTRNGGSHGWARVSLAAADEAAAVAAAAAAVEHLDGRLALGGVALSVSPSCGRADCLFPGLPYPLRAGLRLDATAAYSATDQATADAMTQLLATLAERLVLQPLAPRLQPAAAAAPPVPQCAGAPQQESDAIVAGQQLEKEEKVLQPPPASSWVLLPLDVTDGTACCGGNSLSLARRFRRVVAVELDADRAEDLRHNAALLSAWSGFCARRAEQLQQEPGGAAPCQTPLQSTHVAEPRPRPQQHQQAPLGVLQVVCADYNQRLAGAGGAGATGGESSAVVFMDPPWGGPQYLGSTTTPTPGPAAHAGSVAAAPGTAAGAAPQLLGAGPGPAGPRLPRGDAAFGLGARPLSHIVAQLLTTPPAAPAPLADAPAAGAPAEEASAVAAAACRAGAGSGTSCGRLVALKLPSRASEDLRALQARVRELVAAKAAAGPAAAPAAAAPMRTAGGNAAVDVASGREDAAVGVGEGAEGGGGGGSGPRHVLGAEVTFGRSALVVFMAAADPCVTSSGGDGTGSDESDEEQADGAGGVGGKGRGRKGAVCGCGCESCVLRAAAFRAVLKEVCGIGLGVPYRVVCT